MKHPIFVDIHGKTLQYHLIEVPKSPLGSKGFLIDEKGIFQLESAPTVLRGMACTHSGSGVFEVFDGRDVLESGFFPPIPGAPEGAPNGRRIYKSVSSQLGMWTLNIGLHHGLTIFAHGGTDGIPTVATIIWEPVMTPKKPKLVTD